MAVLRKERNDRSAEDIITPVDREKKQAWNPWIILGVICFLLNHLLRDRLHMPGAAWAGLQAFFAGITVIGIIRVLQLKKIKNLRQAQEDSGEDQKRRHLETEIKTMYETVKMVQGSLSAMEEEGRDKEICLENVREQKKEHGSVSADEQELLRKREAVCLAEETIMKLSADFQSDRDDFLNERMSEIISQITAGKYDDIRLNENQGIKVASEFQLRRPEAYSQATMQQMYFAYRMAAGGQLAKEEKLPLMFDEAFAGYDKKRLTAVLQWLERQNHQVFLFTCRELEADILRENQIKFKEIRL